LKDDELFEDESGLKGNGNKKNSSKSEKNTFSKKQGPSQKLDLMSQNIGLVWAVGLVVVAFVVGFFIRGLFMSSAQTGGNMMQAPPLTEEQMRSGEMPSGHPSVGEMPVEEAISTTEANPMGGMGIENETTATP